MIIVAFFELITWVKDLLREYNTFVTKMYVNTI